jgi:hypothetical protein
MMMGRAEVDGSITGQPPATRAGSIFPRRVCMSGAH